MTWSESFMILEEMSRGLYLGPLLAVHVNVLDRPIPLFLSAPLAVPSPCLSPVVTPEVSPYKETPAS